jgi:hypothetical protein
MTTTDDTTEQGGTVQEDHTMDANTLHETARSGRYGLEAIRRAEAGDEGDGLPAMMRTIGGFTYALETGGTLWIMEKDPGEGALYKEPVKVSPQETARLFRFFMPIALEQLLDYGKDYDKARETPAAE